MFYEAALLGASISAWCAFAFFRKSTLHGKSFKDKGIHKDAFVFFYLNGLVWLFALSLFFPATSPVYFLALHLIRRFAESATYTYGERSYMSFVHFAGGMMYYPLIVYRAYHSFHPFPSLFLVSSIMQALSHFLLFRKRVFVFYLQYLTEALIHYAISQDIYNILWIVSFSFISILNR